MTNKVQRFLDNPENKEVLQLCGIYQLQNRFTKKAYIGSTSRSFGDRLGEHYSHLEAKTHPNPHLQNSYSYRPHSFTFDILEAYPQGRISIDKMIEREQYWMDTTNPEFNVHKNADFRILRLKKKPTTYTVIDDLGVEYSFENIRSFIRDYQAQRPNYKVTANYLSLLVRGKKSDYKGWTTKKNSK